MAIFKTLPKEKRTKAELVAEIDRLRLELDAQANMIADLREDKVIVPVAPHGICQVEGCKQKNVATACKLLEVNEQERRYGDAVRCCLKHARELCKHGTHLLSHDFGTQCPNCGCYFLSGLVRPTGTKTLWIR